MNPFKNFSPQNYCPVEQKVVDVGHCQDDYFAILEPFILDVSLTKDEDRCVIASLDDLQYPLYTIDDLLRWTSMSSRGTNDVGLATNIKGYLGEKLLSLMMDVFLRKVAERIPSTVHSEAGVLVERGKARGRGYVARFDDNWLLRFKYGSSFVLIGKGEAATSDVAYRQEKMGMLYTEIDGLGYLVSNGQKYLIAGESTTKKQFLINSWQRGSGATSNSFEERVFLPLKDLFPEHKLIYFIMAYSNTLYDNTVHPYHLKKGPLNLMTHLKEYDVDTIFVPIPQTEKSLHQVANKIIQEQIPLIRAVFREEFRMYTHV